MRGPWTASFGLHPVESQMAGGKGLSVGDVNGKIDGEDRGKQDDAQKATTSPANEAIEKSMSKNGKAKFHEVERMPSWAQNKKVQKRWRRPPSFSCLSQSPRS